MVQAATVLVSAPVAERRKELMEQIAVSGMNLDYLETCRQSSAGRGFEGGNAFVQGSVVELDWSRFAVVKRNGTGSDGRPAAALRIHEPSAAEPRRLATGL